MTFWIQEAAPPSNKARKGDADYGAKAWNEPAEDRKKAAKKTASGSSDDKHPRGKQGTKQGGKFVKKGDSGSAVGDIQDKLGIESTQVYDAGTAASIVSFQKRHGLVVDGIVGRQTALALAGQYERARALGPGALGPKTSGMVGVKYQEPGSRGRRGRRARMRPAGERVRGGAVIAQLQEDFNAGQARDPRGRWVSVGGKLPVGVQAVRLGRPKLDRFNPGVRKIATQGWDSKRYEVYSGDQRLGEVFAYETETSSEMASGIRYNVKKVTRWKHSGPGRTQVESTSRKAAVMELLRAFELWGQLEEEEEPVAENLVDAWGNVHDLLGKFAPKFGKHGGGHEAAVIPEYDPSKLTFGKSAGGSNGARFASHADGGKWLVKGYQGDQDRVATELLANAVYREMGARVPRAGRIRLHSGNDAIAYPLVEGKPRKRVFQKKGARPSPAVGKHFMTDALLANWDVAGMEDDNILWDPKGEPFRVDQGGTLEYRAMGGRKDFGPVPLEVTTMLRPGAQGRRAAFVTGPGLTEQARELHESLTPEKIRKLAAAAGFRDARMRDRVERMLSARADWMGRFSRGEVGMPDAPLPPPPKWKGTGFKDPTIMEAAWLAPIMEAALPYEWKEALHPRDQHGQFIKKIGGLPGGKAIQLDSKTTIKKDKDGTFRVVRSGGIIKGFKTPDDAARAALDRSAKSKDGDSVGGQVGYKDYDAYLKAQGVNPDQIDSFGGKKVTLKELEAERDRLHAALLAASGSEDKYVLRSVPTLEARLGEAGKKLKDWKGSPRAAPMAEPPRDPKPDGIYGLPLRPVLPGDLVRVSVRRSVDHVPDLRGVAWDVTSGKPLAGGAIPFLKDSPHLKMGAPPPGLPGSTTKLSAKNAIVQKGTTFVNSGDSQWVVSSVDMNAKTVTVSPVAGTNEDPAVLSWAIARKQVEVGNWTAVKIKASADKVATGEGASGPKGTGSPSVPNIPTPGSLIKGHQVKNLPVGTTLQVKFSTNPGFNLTVFVHAGDGKIKAASLADDAAGQTAKADWTLKIVEPPATGKPGKLKGPQATETEGLGNGVKAMVGQLDLAAGDLLQWQKGGWKWKVTEVTPTGGVKVEGANGSKKTWGKWAQIGVVHKADGSKLKLKALEDSTPGATPAPPPSKTLSVAEIEAKLGSAPPGVTIGQLKDGDVIGSPGGQIGIIKPGEAAYQGYVTAYDIKTGQKFEPPAGKPPLKFSNDPVVKLEAEKALAKAQAGTIISTSTGGGGTVGASPAAQIGPPPEFDGVASWSAAVPHVPAASSVDLTPEERKAIKSYTGSGYGPINGALRDSKAVKSLPVAKQAAAIKSALRKGKVTKDVWIGRRTDVAAWHDAVAGQALGDNGVMSASYSPTSWAGKIHLNILVREGSPALNVEGVSNHPAEKEIFLPPGSLFHVLKREEKNNAIVLYVEML